jgi:sugar phosphate isomerase/epimerase
MTLGFITDYSENDFWFALEHGLELEMTVNPPFDALDNLDRVLDLQEKYGVTGASCGVWGGEYLSADAATAKAAASLVPKLIDFTLAVGASTCCIGGGSEIEGISLQEHVDRFLPLLRPWIDYADDNDVRLAIYNCHWANFAYKPEAWDLIWGALGDTTLGIKFDPSHPFYDNRCYLQELLDWGDKVSHVHAKDTLKIGDCIVQDVPPGLGSIDWGRVVGTLDHHGYGGCVAMEPHSEGWLGPRRYEGILLGVDYLRNFIM